MEKSNTNLLFTMKWWQQQTH